MSDRAAAAERYAQWKSLVPVLYDWLTNHNVVWPSLSCRWGPRTGEATYKNRQPLYLSERTNGSVPNTLVISNVEVVKPRVAAAEHISNFNEEASSPFVRTHKIIVHPGEVNRIRELPQNGNIVGRHTDSPEVLIWDIEAQPSRSPVPGVKNSCPNLVLTGHQDIAEFAHAMCPAEPFVLSGGKDKSVVLWSIKDHISILAETSSKSRWKSSFEQSTTFGNTKVPKSPSVGPWIVFQGHEDTVEDVQFCPSSAQEFCSVGDDSCLILWDARVGVKPVIKASQHEGFLVDLFKFVKVKIGDRAHEEWIEKAHNTDLHCVDWNPHNSNLLITGSADNSVRMFDHRNLISGGVGSPVYIFRGHTHPVLCVQWLPDKSSVFGSAAEDCFLNIWDHEKVGKKKQRTGPMIRTSASGLIFQHSGHRDEVVDFHWNPSDPWTIASISDECKSVGGGGTLQMWRMSDLIYRLEEEVLAELEKFQTHILPCGSGSKF